MTAVAVNTYTHSVTYVADNILKCHSACNFDPLSRGIGVQN